MKSNKRFLVLFLWLSLATCSFVTGQTRESIEKVDIRGNHRIPQETILYYIMSRPGDVYEMEKIQQDFNSLFKTGLFKNIKVDVAAGEAGKIITFIVDEKPIVRSIEYDGIKSFKKSDVLDKFNEAKLGMTVDSPFEPTKIKKAEKIIKNLLILNGRPLGTVNTVVEDIPPNSVKITFKIEEGEKVRIGRIEFTGNSVFNKRRLKSSLKLDKERGLISMFKGTDKYHHDKLLYDLEENLKTLYQQFGYLDMKYGEPNVRIVEGPRGFIPLMRKTKKQFYITVPVDEGPQYRVNSIAFDGNTLFKSEQLAKIIGLNKGEIANFKAVKDGQQNIKKLYGMYGYIDIDINPEVKRDQKNLLVDITFNIEQGKQYRVNRIEFFGNTRTRDKVMRREFQLVEQEIFSQVLLDLSIQRMNQLGLFEKIEEKDYEIKRKQEEALVDVNVTVQEKGQQSIGLTAGVSGYQGSFVGLNYSTNNFLGYGDKFAVDTIFGTRMLDISLSFTNPYFLDTNTLFGFSVYSRRNKFDVNNYSLVYTPNAEQLFIQKTKGFSVTLGRPLTLFWRYYFTYELQYMSFPIDDINPNYRYLVEAQLVNINPGMPLEKALSGLLRSEIGFRLQYNSTDDYFFPKRGKEFTLGATYSGGFLGGDFNMINPSMEFKWFHRDKFISHGRNVFATHAMVQSIFPLGKTKAVPFFQRFFMGGEYDVRGFELRQVSPYAMISNLSKDAKGQPLIDPLTGAALRNDFVSVIGGDLAILGQAEYRIPIAGPVTLILYGDVGLCTILQKDKLGFSEETNIYLLESTNRKVRASTGVEVQFMVPMINAPFRLIYAYNPITMNQVFSTKDYPHQIYKEKRSNVLFSIGKSF